MDDLTYQPVKHNHEEYLREELKDEEFRKGYEALLQHTPLSENFFWLVSRLL